MTVGIISTGSGNTLSVQSALDSLHVPSTIVYEPSQLFNLSHIIFPGVGSFDYIVNSLISSGLFSPLKSLITYKSIPYLGICVGMQVLLDTSLEGNSHGFGIIPGCVRLLPSSSSLPVPHMGWNTLNNVSPNPLFNGLDDQEFYFLHSYYCDVVDSSLIQSRSQYTINFPSAISQDNIYGVQFHPEKSHLQGAKLFSNFLET